MRIDLDWQYREGRDRDGERFRIWCLVHSSGRVLAKVWCPLGGDDFLYTVTFYVDEMAELKDNATFMELDSAKRFAERSLEKFGLTAVPAVPVSVAPAVKRSWLRRVLAMLGK